MFTKADLLARLQNGDSIEDIANEMTDALNAAKDEYLAIQEEQAKVEAAEKEAAMKAEAEKKAKREAMFEVLSAVGRYADVAGLDVADILSIEYTDEALDEYCAQVDTMLELAKSLEALSQLQFGSPVEKDEKATCAASAPQASSTGLEWIDFFQSFFE